MFSATAAMESDSLSQTGGGALSHSVCAPGYRRSNEPAARQLRSTPARPAECRPASQARGSPSRNSAGSSLRNSQRGSRAPLSRRLPNCFFSWAVEFLGKVSNKHAGAGPQLCGLGEGKKHWLRSRSLPKRHLFHETDKN